MNSVVLKEIKNEILMKIEQEVTKFDEQYEMFSKSAMSSFASRFKELNKNDQLIIRKFVDDIK